MTIGTERSKPATGCDYCKNISVCAICGKGYAEAICKNAAASPCWISVSERLPAFFQPVALIHEHTWLNTGNDDININKVDAGYLQEFGCCWATAGSHRAMTLDAFTHWMPLPLPPGESAGSARSDKPAASSESSVSVHKEQQ